MKLSNFHAKVATIFRQAGPRAWQIGEGRRFFVSIFMPKVFKAAKAPTGPFPIGVAEFTPRGLDFRTSAFHNSGRMARLFGYTLIGTTLLLLCAAFVWPMVFAVGDTWFASEAGSPALSGYRLTLLVRGLKIAAAAALAAQPIGAGLAAGLVHRSGVLRGLATWTAFTMLLTPTYLYAYAANVALLPTGANTIASLDRATGALFSQDELRAVACEGCWLASLAAIILATGWRVAARPALALAALDAGPVIALRRVAIPALRGWIALSLLACLLLATTDFAVPNIMAVQVWNTEVLAATQLIEARGAALRLAWPLVVLVGLMAGAIYLLRRPLSAQLDEFAVGPHELPDSRPRASSAMHWAGGLCAAAAGTIVLLPWAVFIGSVRGVHSFRGVLESFPAPLRAGVQIGLGAAAFAAILSLGGAYLALLASVGRRSYARRAAGLVAAVLLASALVAAIVPPVLIGDAFAGAYVHADFVRDSVMIISLTALARFGLFAILAVRFAQRRIDREQVDAGRSDGAGPPQLFMRVVLPQLAAATLLGATIAGMLSTTDIAATQLVIPAGVESLAATLLNHIHFGRNEVVVALSLCVMAVIAAVVAAMQLLARVMRPAASPKMAVRWNRP